MGKKSGTHSTGCSDILGKEPDCFFVRNPGARFLLIELTTQRYCPCVYPVVHRLPGSSPVYLVCPEIFQIRWGWSTEELDLFKESTVDQDRNNATS